MAQTFKVASKFSLIHDEAAYLLTIESQVMIDVITMQSDIAIDLMDTESSVAVVNRVEDKEN